MNRAGTLEQLETVNIARAPHFGDYKYFEKRDILFFANAMSGEAGEFANLLKKMLRGDKYDRDGITELTPEYICEELADVIIYASFIASIYGLNLPELLVKKFNDVSTNKGLNIFLHP